MITDAVDVARQDPKRGGVRNRIKTHIILYATPKQRQQHPHEWNLDLLRDKATVNQPTADLKTLGATLGGPQRRRDIVHSRLKGCARRAAARLGVGALAEPHARCLPTSLRAPGIYSAPARAELQATTSRNAAPLTPTDAPPATAELVCKQCQISRET